LAVPQLFGRAGTGTHDNSDKLLRILQIRREQAQLLGYASFAEMSLAQKMAPSVEAVYRLLEDLRTASWSGAEQELADMQACAGRHGFHQPLVQWDMAYWAKRLQEERFQFRDEDLRCYFALPRVLEGLFALVHKLFGIQVEAADGQAPVWHSDVRFFNIYNHQRDHIASFYLDPYSRPENKRSGAWMDDCVSHYRDAGGELSLPVAYLFCNMAPPLAGAPALMTFNEVETLFHEFGHGLQHMLTQVEYLDVSGINGVEWDAVELPSQFMENWCYHRPTLMGMARHYHDGSPLPDELFTKLNAAKTFRAGQMMLRQLQFALVDLRLHDGFDPFAAESPFTVQVEVAQITSLLPPLPEDRFLCSFSHIFCGGYAAGYYSYKWAEVLSADAFHAFEEAGLDTDDAMVSTGQRFRETILALGGSVHPLQVFTQFRGREPQVEA
jgi:oligopeptidase A